MSGSERSSSPSSGSGAHSAGSVSTCVPCTVTIAPMPLVVCAGCTGGTQTETPTATASPAGGTHAWSTANPAVATAAGSGASARVTGATAGDTTVRDDYSGTGCPCHAEVPVKAVRVDLVLRNSGKITAAPENSTRDADANASGGVDDLGPLPMGQGRGDFAGQAYTSPIEIVATVSASGATGLTFRWKRLITRRSWNIRHDAGTATWTVTQRTRRGFPDDDTGAASFNNPVPNANRRMYMYDDSGLLPGNVAADRVGDFLHEEKDFTYRLERDNRGTWVTCAEFRVGQLITTRRIATTGTTATDWSGVENSTAVRTVSATIDVAKVRAIVGGSDAISIAANANN